MTRETLLEAKDDGKFLNNQVESNRLHRRLFSVLIRAAFFLADKYFQRAPTSYPDCLRAAEVTVKDVGDAAEAAFGYVLECLLDWRTTSFETIHKVASLLGDGGGVESGTTLCTRQRYRLLQPSRMTQYSIDLPDGDFLSLGTPDPALALNAESLEIPNTPKVL